MEHDMYDILQECSRLTPYEAVQKLKKHEGFIASVNNSLCDQYKKQAGHPIYSTLFELYRSNSKEARCFVLQFLPSLIWIYLSAKARRDKQGYGKLEAIFLAIYNAEVQDRSERKNPLTFRLPSLSRPSIYHESSADMMSQSPLTESALSRHELAETPIVGPTKEITSVTASNRMPVLCVALRQYNKFIGVLNKSSYNSFWLMAIRVSSAGFHNICTPENSASQLAGVMSNEELSLLANHPRISLSAEYIQQLVHSLYFLMYNGCSVQASKAIESLHFRASHSLFAPANVLSSAVLHSMQATNGLPHDGPLGLNIQVSGSQRQDYKHYSSALVTHGMSAASPSYKLANYVGDKEDSKPLKIQKKINSTDNCKNLPYQKSKSNFELTDILSKEPDNAAVSEDNIITIHHNSEVYTTKF